MKGFESYYHIIDLVDNPNYNFLSYNIDPNLVIYTDGFKRTIQEEYESECFPCVNELTKRDKSIVHFIVSQSLIILSIVVIIYLLLGLIRYFFFSDFVFNDKALWFFVFGFAFLIPLLFGFYRLASVVIASNKHYKELCYQAFALSNRMLSDQRIATSLEISESVDELTFYFGNSYRSFDDGKHIKKFFEKRFNRIPLSYYNDFKKQSTRYSFEKQSPYSIVAIVLELLVGIVGTVLNIIKDYSIIESAFEKMVTFMIIMVLLVVSVSYLVHCINAYKMREVFYYYYIYSYLFLESTTDKNTKVSYSFNFPVNNKNNELSVFKDLIFRIVRSNKIPAFRRDIEIVCEDDKTNVVFYGVDDYDATLDGAVNSNSFNEFFDHISHKTSK